METFLALLYFSHLWCTNRWTKGCINKLNRFSRGKRRIWANSLVSGMLLSGLTFSCCWAMFSCSKEDFGSSDLTLDPFMSVCWLLSPVITLKILMQNYYKRNNLSFLGMLSSNRKTNLKSHEMTHRDSSNLSQSSCCITKHLSNTLCSTSWYLLLNFESKLQAQPK